MGGGHSHKFHSGNLREPLKGKQSKAARAEGPMRMDSVLIIPAPDCLVSLGRLTIGTVRLDSFCLDGAWPSDLHERRPLLPRP